MAKRKIKMENENAPEKGITEGINFNEIMEAAKEKVHAGLIESIAEELKSNLSWELKDQIEKAIQKFFDEEIAPTLPVLLFEQKEEILTGISAACSTFGEALSKTLMQAFLQKVAGLDSWNIKKIFEAIL
jgi:hypothetical protein